MNRVTKFVDVFWGADFCSTAGFDALIKRVKEGRQVCKDLEEFLKQRAKIEEEYGKALLKLSSATGGKDETGTSRSTWEVLKQQIDKVASVHIQLSSSIMEQVTRVNSLAEKHRDKRKQIEETVKKDQNAKKTHYKKTHDQKKTYEAKCTEADLAEKMVKSTNVLQQKEKDKLEAKQQKARQEADKQDGLYKTSVGNLETVRLQWEKSMTQACESFQATEEERLQFLRNEIWFHMNLCSHACVDDDESYENVRVSLENGNLENDLFEYIEQNKTGCDRPVPIVYENFYSTKRSSPESMQKSTSSISQTFQNVGAAFTTLTKNKTTKDSYTFQDDGTYSTVGSWE